MSRANHWANVPCVSSRTFWSQSPSQRASTFEELRQTAPISLQETPDFGVGEAGRSFWAVTRHADVTSVSRSPELFCSGKGIGMGDTSADVLELTAALPLMDPPRLMAVRRVVSGAFSPKRVAQLKLRIGRSGRTHRGRVRRVRRRRCRSRFLEEASHLDNLRDAGHTRIHAGPAVGCGRSAVRSRGSRL